MARGYYVKKGKDKELILNVFKADFMQLLSESKDVNGWVKFKIFENERPASNGLTHNMVKLEPKG